MKTLNSLLAASLLSLSATHAHAQYPTVGAAGLNPLPGEAYTVYFCDYISPGFGGENQTWDFTSIACTTEPPSIYQDPAGNGYFPTATVTFDDFYLEGSSAALLELGYSAPGPDVMTCTDPLKLFMYPMTYGDQFTDNLECDRSGPSISHRSGNATVVADGYGTVILPYATITDCLRIHEDRNYADVSEPPGMTANFHRDYYHFVKPGIKRPLVSVLQTTWSINGGPWSTGSSASMLVDLTTGIGSAHSAMPALVRPNPMDEQTTIELPGVVIGPDAQLVITDALGRAVRNERITAMPFVLQRNGLMNGLYTYRILASVQVLASGTIAVR